MESITIEDQYWDNLTRRAAFEKLADITSSDLTPRFKHNGDVTIEGRADLIDNAITTLFPFPTDEQPHGRKIPSQTEQITNSALDRSRSVACLLTKFQAEGGNEHTPGLKRYASERNIPDKLLQVCTTSGSIMIRNEYWDKLTRRAAFRMLTKINAIGLKPKFKRNGDVTAIGPADQIEQAKRLLSICPTDEQLHRSQILFDSENAKNPLPCERKQHPVINEKGRSRADETTECIPRRSKEFRSLCLYYEGLSPPPPKMGASDGVPWKRTTNKKAETESRVQPSAIEMSSEQTRQELPELKRSTFVTNYSETSGKVTKDVKTMQPPDALQNKRSNSVWTPPTPTETETDRRRTFRTDNYPSAHPSRWKPEPNLHRAQTDEGQQASPESSDTSPAIDSTNTTGALSGRNDPPMSTSPQEQLKSPSARAKSPLHIVGKSDLSSLNGAAAEGRAKQNQGQTVKPDALYLKPKSTLHGTNLFSTESIPETQVQISAAACHALATPVDVISSSGAVKGAIAEATKDAIPTNTKGAIPKTTKGTIPMAMENVAPKATTDVATKATKDSTSVTTKDATPTAAGTDTFLNRRPDLLRTDQQNMSPCGCSLCQPRNAVSVEMKQRGLVCSPKSAVGLQPHNGRISSKSKKGHGFITITYKFSGGAQKVSASTF